MLLLSEWLAATSGTSRFDLKLVPVLLRTHVSFRSCTSILAKLAPVLLRIRVSYATCTHCWDCMSALAYTHSNKARASTTETTGLIQHTYLLL